jgi:hypothetical protein
MILLKGKKMVLELLIHQEHKASVKMKKTRVNKEKKMRSV